MPTSAIGVDLGNDTLKAARVTLVDGKLALNAIGFMPLGEIGHMPESSDRSLALKAKFQQMVREAGLQGGLFRARSVNLGLAGAKVSFRFLQTIPVPKMLLEKKVAFEVSENITAKSKVPLSYNYRILDTPQPDQTNALIGLAVETEVENARQECKHAQLGEVEIDFSMLGLYNAYLYGHGPCYKTSPPPKAPGESGQTPAVADLGGEPETVAVVDIGAGEIKILICNGDDLYFVKATAGGGLRFSQSLAKLLNVNLFEAEAAKCEDAEVTIDPQSGNTLRLTRNGLARPSGPNANALSDDTGDPGDPGAPSEDTFSEGAVADSDSDPDSDPDSVTDSATDRSDDLPGNNTDSSRATDADSDAWLDTAADNAKTSNAPVTNATSALAGSPKSATTSASATMPPAQPVTRDTVVVEKAAAATPPVEAVPGPASLTTTSGGTLIDPAALDSGESILNIEPPPEKTIAPEEPGARQQQQRRISNLLVREAAAICANIESTVQFCRQQNRIRTLRLSRVLITGGGARLKGLTGYMQRRMRLPVEELDPFRNIQIALPEPQFVRLKAERDRLAVPIGLAIGMLKPGAARMPIITAAESGHRHLIQRSIYLYYSAVLLVAVVALGFFFAARHNAAYADQNTAIKNRYNQARMSSESLNKKMRELELLRRETNAVELRVNSGSFIADLLTTLKSRDITQDSIWFTEIATVAPDFYHREELKKELFQDDAVMKELAEIHANAHLLRDKRLYLRGFAKSTKSRSEALQYSIDLVDRLSKSRAKTDPDRAKAIFDDAWMIYSNDANPKELPNDSKNLFVKEFVIECRLYEQKSVVIEKSVLPPAPGEGDGPPPVLGAPPGSTPKAATPVKPGVVHVE